MPRAFVGMRVVKREQNPSDGSIAVEVEVLPGMPAQRITFQPDQRPVEDREPF